MLGLRLFLLGPPKIEFNGIPVKMDTRKVMALLAYLAVMGESYRRDSLVNLLWPEYDLAHGRAVLRRTLSALSSALPESSLDADRETIGIRPGIDLWLDVAEFNRLLAERRSHGHSESEVCPDCLPNLAETIALYRDDFMSGFSLSDSYNFDDWQFFQAESLHQEMGSALEKFAQCLVLSGDLDTALQMARRRLALDRLNEAAHCDLMRLYAWTQQRSAALRQYQECKSILQSQLGVEPQMTTTELYHAIEKGQCHSPAPDPSWQRANDPEKLSQRTNLTAPLANLKPAGLALPENDGLTGEEITSLPVSPQDQVVNLEQPADVKKIVTALFFEMCQQTGPNAEERSVKADYFEDSIQQMRDFLAHTRPVLDQYGGQIEQQIGQNALILFGLAQAHENDPELALRAAVELNHQASQFGLCIAAGLTTGEVYIRFNESQRAQTLDLSGSAIATAIFMAGQAQAGEILAAESTYQLTRKTFKFTPFILPTKHRGVLATVYQVERLLPLAQKTRGIEGLQSKLVGRDRELAGLGKALANASSGAGELVAVIGEAGVGKSRLLEEFHQQILAEQTPPVPLWLEGRCLELSMEVSYWPFMDLLKVFFNWQLQEVGQVNNAQIPSAIQQLVSGGHLSAQRGREIETLLNHLLFAGPEAGGIDPLANLTPDEIRQRTFLALRDFLLALSLQQPLVLVFEDLHWADHLSLDLFYFIMESLTQGHILLVAVFRPEEEYRTRYLAAIAGRTCRGHFTEIRIREMSLVESFQMIDFLLGEGHLTEELKSLIWERCQGNPFFIEEVIQSLIDAGAIYQERGQWQVSAEFDSAQLPASIQSVILSRLDHLDEDWRQVLQAAAVIGMVFRKKVLKQALPVQIDVEKILWEMEGRGLIYHERVIPEEEYSFRHVLMQEAIYQNILRNRRKLLHQAAAEGIEKLYSERLEEHYESLAYHYEKSGNIRQTIAYLFKAGEKASLSYANETALTQLILGLELLRSLPETLDRKRQEIDFLLAQGVSLVHSRGHADDLVLETYTRARDLCHETGDSAHLYDVLLGLRRFTLTRGQMQEALVYSQQMLELGLKHNDPSEQGRAYMMLIETLYYLADFLPIPEYNRKGLALIRDQDRYTHIHQYGNDTCLGCQMFLPEALWQLGYPDQAQAELDHQEVLLAGVTHPFSRVMSMFFATIAFRFLRQAQVVQNLMGEMLPMAEDHGYVLFQMLALIQLGWAQAAQGQLEAGTASLTQGIEGLRALKATLFITTPLGSLGEVLAQSGKVDAGLAAIEEGLDISQETGIVNYLAELHRLKGEVLRQKGDETGAETSFLEAIEVARSQQARSWELRAAASLARLWKAQGRKGEAFTLLNSIYDWFTEGFDSADLRDAKTLLNQLHMENNGTGLLSNG